MLNESELLARFAFEDDASGAARTALQLRIGPARQHRDVTYVELATAARARASALLALGCAPGERVALLMPHSEQLVFAFFGALYAGLVPSIVAWPTSKMDPEKYRRNLVAVVESLAARVLVTEAAMVAQLGSAVGSARVVDPAQLALEEQPVPAPALRREGHAFIQFSGGTTGTQKSVPISYALLQQQLSSYARALALRPDDRVISWLPLYHDMGLIACLLLPFVFRLPVVMFSPIEWVMDPRPFVRAIGRERATLFWMPSFAFAFLAARSGAPSEPYDLSSVRAAINCSEPVRAASMDAFHARFAGEGLRREALAACYAMAEATFAVTQTRLGEPAARLRVSSAALSQGRVELDAKGDRELVSCGAPIEHVAVQVVADDAAPCPEGSIGEIWVRGPSIMHGYLDAPGDPRAGEAFSEGWYRTGDLGAYVAGQLFVTGRKKDLIIVGGVNVYPEDVEAAVGRVPGIHAGRVVALGVVDQALGTERLVVAAEVSEAADMARAPAIEAEIRKAILATAGLAPFKVFVVPPRWIVKSTAGKVARRETRERILAAWDELTTPAKETS